MKNRLMHFIAILMCAVLITSCIAGCRAENDTLPNEGTGESTAQQLTDDTIESTAATENAESDSQSNTEDTLESTMDEAVSDSSEPELTDEPTETTEAVKPPTHKEPENDNAKPSDTEPPEATTPPATQKPEATEPQVTEPPQTVPAEVIDMDALVQYGLQYAADTHGYRISPGTRDGYYPAYTCSFDTMEEGRAAIRGCVDDTTRALLAVPGRQIVVEINGQFYRVHIDIVITDRGNGTYAVSVYYG